MFALVKLPYTLYSMYSCAVCKLGVKYWNSVKGNPVRTTWTNCKYRNKRRFSSLAHMWLLWLYSTLDCYCRGAMQVQPRTNLYCFFTKMFLVSEDSLNTVVYTLKLRVALLQQPMLQIQIRMNPRWLKSAGSGSGSSRAKTTHKNRKKVEKFLVLKCWMFCFEGFEGFSCSMDAILIQKILIFFQLLFF
jgi:hypothetical protein